MPLPLEIATTPHAHDAQVGEIIDLLCKPSICGPISDILGQDAFMEAATDLTQRLYLGEYAAALARYSDESSNTIKPVGTIIYSQDSNDPKITNLELIVVREKYRRRKVSWYAIITTSRGWNSITRRNAITNTSAPENARPTELLGRKRLLFQPHERERGRGFVFAI